MIPDLKRDHSEKRLKFLQEENVYGRCKLSVVGEPDGSFVGSEVNLILYLLGPEVCH